jgi:hypothetical protein
MVVSGQGIYASYDVSGLFDNAVPENTTSTKWIFENDGIEETVPLELISPPSGANLISAIGDIDGFVHSDLDESPAHGRLKTAGTHIGTTRSIAFAENVPDKLVKAYDNDEYNKGAISTDGGFNWTPFTSKPAGVGASDSSGKITISADGKTIVWAPDKVSIAYSNDDGESWINSSGNVPAGLKPVADRVDSSAFYVFDPADQILYFSNDGATSFTGISLNLPGISSYTIPQPEVKAVFGQQGHLWLANHDNGLFHSTDGGQSWFEINNVNSAYKVTTGKAAPGKSYPAIYIWGIVNSIEGLFRSDDQGVNWVRINDEETEWARNHTDLTGDPRIYGRIYIGLGGRGIVYGDIK